MIYFVTDNQELKDLYKDDEQIQCSTVDATLNLLDAMSVIGLDTETTGLDPFTNNLLSLQLGDKHNQVVVDVQSVGIEPYRKLLENPNKLYIIHNALFDLKWLYKEGIILKQVYDTMLVEKILYLGIPSGMVSVSLKECCKRYLGIDMDKTVRGKIIYEGLSRDVIIYSATDVVYLEDIRSRQMNTIKMRKQQLAVNVENEFVKALAYIEFCGIKLDPDRWKAKMKRDITEDEKLKAQLDEWVINYVMSDPDRKYRHFCEVVNTIPKNLSPKIFVTRKQRSLFSEEDPQPECIINWSSSTQLIPLFESLGLNLNSNGKVSVDKKVLKPQEDKCELVPLYLKYSEVHQNVTAFGDKFLKAINPVTGRIHSEYTQLLNTSRVGCGSGTNGINLQQIPRDDETRKCFVPEEGNVLIDIDYGDWQCVSLFYRQYDAHIFLKRKYERWSHFAEMRGYNNTLNSGKEIAIQP